MNKHSEAKHNKIMGEVNGVYWMTYILCVV